MLWSAAVLPAVPMPRNNDAGVGGGSPAGSVEIWNGASQVHGARDVALFQVFTAHRDDGKRHVLNVLLALFEP